MPRRQKQYHFIYKTTNVINEKFYVGMHSTDDLNDGYLGSGKRLKYSINKYGKENFIFEILEFFEDRKTLIEREENLINEDFIKNPLCMNLMKGGTGGLLSEAHHLKMREGASKFAKKQWEDDEFRVFKNSLTSVQFRNYNLNIKTKFDNFKGKTHSKESKIKMSKKAQQRIGDKNSQFGTCWIYKNKENKKIQKEKLNDWIKLGWIKGRKIK